VRWRGLAAVAAAVLAAALVAQQLCVPESPRWLLARGRRAAAVRALCRLRGPATDAEQAVAQVGTVRIIWNGSVRGAAMGC
jgi:SP family facilitated glucose transporter-like MFS transporter 8